MKYIIIVLLAVVMAGCKKEPQNKSTSENLYNPKWIPNWHGADTLKGTVIDSIGHSAGYDTIYTATYGDTSCIWYKGSKYYVWGSTYYNTIRQEIDSFKDNEMIYAHTYIGSIAFDTISGIMDHGNASSVFPHKYINQSGQWQHKRQTIILHSTANFKNVSFNNYSSNRVY